VVEGGKQPYAIARQDGEPIAFAGLWESYRWCDQTVTRSEAEPRTVVCKGMVIDHNPDAGPFLLHLRNFRRIGFACHRAVACFVVPDVVRPDASRHEVKLSLMPDLFPPVEQIAQHGSICHCATACITQRLCPTAPKQQRSGHWCKRQRLHQFGHQASTRPDARRPFRKAAASEA
jgi:hypothetical protein